MKECFFDITIAWPIENLTVNEKIARISGGTFHFFFLKHWPNDWTFLSTFAIHLYCKRLVMHCIVAKQLGTS